MIGSGPLRSVPCSKRALSLFRSFWNMSKVKFFQGLALTALVLCIVSVPSFAQGKKDKDKDTPTQDINDKQRNVKPELKDAYKKWINTDVAYIITKDEKKAFYALQT